MRTMFRCSLLSIYRVIADRGNFRDVRDKHQNNPESFYRATRLRSIFLPPTLFGTYANVDGVPCEIQVCSMMAHVWNEIEHDLGYKPLSGVLSELEKSMLVNLGHRAAQEMARLVNSLRRPTRGTPIRQTHSLMSTTL